MNSNHTIPVTMEPMHNDLEHVFLAGSLLLIMIASLAGNIMVCITVYKKRRLRTRSISFIINLALADLGVVTFCMPFSLVACLSHVWSLGDVMCQLNGLLNVVFTQTSLLTLTAIAIDKYCTIVWPLKKVMTVRRTLFLLLWTWLQPIIIAVIPFAGLFKYRFKPGTTQCGPEFPRNLKQSIYGIFVCIVGYFIPLGILGYVYTKIFHSAKQSTHRISRVSISSSTSTNSLSTHKKVAITVMILVLLFLSCWSPYFVYVIIIISNPLLSTNTHIFALGKASYWMAFLCSALNPYIYGARNPAFRKEFKLLLCCMCPCFARPLKFKRCFIGSSKGSWGRMGASDDSNDFRRYNFAYAPQDRVRSSDRMGNSNGSNEGHYFTHLVHFRDASWEGMGTSNKSNRRQQYGFAYGQRYMGLKRKRTQGGWGHKRFSESSFSEGNQDDTITSFNERHVRKASQLLRFEDSLSLELPKNDSHRNSSFYIDQGDYANEITKKEACQQHRKTSLQLRFEEYQTLERPSNKDVLFDQSRGDLSALSKKSSYLERHQRKASLKLRFEENTSLSLESISPTSDVPLFNQSEKYSLEERSYRRLSTLEDNLSLESPTSDVPFFDQRKSSFLSDEDVGAVFEKTSIEDRRNRETFKELLFQDDCNVGLESPTSSDALFFDDRTHSYDIDEDYDPNPYFYKPSFGDVRARFFSLKPRFEDDIRFGLNERPPITSSGAPSDRRFRSYSNNIRICSNIMREPSVERNRSHSSYVYYNRADDLQRTHDHDIIDQSYRNRSHSNNIVLEGGLINEAINIGSNNIDSDEDIRADFGCSPSNHVIQESSLSNDQVSVSKSLPDQRHKIRSKTNGCLSNQDHYNRETAFNLIIQQSNLGSCHDKVNNDGTIGHANHSNFISKQTEPQIGNYSNIALSDDNNACCHNNRSSSHSNHGNSKSKQTEQQIGFQNNNILGDTDNERCHNKGDALKTSISIFKNSADRVNSTKRKVVRHVSQHKCRWIESAL